MMKELQQLHDRAVMKPKHASELSKTNKRMCLKQQRCGKIRGRGCADGRKQRPCTKKEDASAPTVAIDCESVMTSCGINAFENRDVATVNIPGAFVHADVDETVHV